MKKAFITTILIIICVTVVISLRLVLKIGQEGTKITENLTNGDDHITYERLKEIREYFFQVKSADGDELIVAELVRHTQYKVSETRREYWTSKILDEGISLGTNTIMIRCPTTHKYFIKISDPWELNVKDGTVYVRPPRIRQLIPPAVQLNNIEIESERGWARLSTSEMEEEALKDFMKVAVTKGNRAIPQVREKANESIAKFVNNWLLRLKEVDMSGLGVEIVKSIPAIDGRSNVNIHMDQIEKNSPGHT